MREIRWVEQRPLYLEFKNILYVYALKRSELWEEVREV